MLQLLDGTITVQRPAVDPNTSEPAAFNVRIAFDQRLETHACVEDLALKKFALVGVAGLEYWVAVQEVGMLEFDYGDKALEVKKLAALRLSDETERNKVLEMGLGQFMNVAYREVNLRAVRCVDRAL